MQNEVLPKLKDPNFKVFVLWTPSYTTDAQGEWVKKGMAIFKDKRVLQYWDEGQKVAGTDGFGNMLKLPRDAPLAYDVYMYFDKKAEWKEKPPMPVDYLHQIYDDGKWFEPQRFIDLVKKVL